MLRQFRLLEEVLRQKVRLDGGDTKLRTLATMNNLASGYKAAGKLDLALPLLEETLKRRKEILGSDHYETLISMILSVVEWSGPSFVFARPSVSCAGTTSARPT